MFFVSRTAFTGNYLTYKLQCAQLRNILIALPPIAISRMATKLDYYPNPPGSIFSPDARRRTL